MSIENNNRKTIKINPELFNSVSKTKKNKDKISRPIIQRPIINPNIIKKQLLNRINEHKNKEKLNTEREKKEEENSFTDEFYDSINYLNSLSKKHKEDSDKKKRESLIHKTIKNPSAIYNRNPIPHVELELPDELKESEFKIELPPTPVINNYNNNNIPMVNTIPEIKLNYNVDNNVPYGCLKNGNKPTYRNWQSTKKNYPTIELSSPSINQNQSHLVNSNSNIQMYERERKLENLKSKLKKLEEYEKNEKLMMSQNLIKKSEDLPLNNIPIESANTNANTIASIIPAIVTMPMPASMPISIPNLIHVENPIPISENKKFLKKTIRRKFTLGKSNIKRKVGILIKDNNTRKKIIEAQKEMKKKSINDIKKHLRIHGLLKVGSNAPNDIIRKTYETSMLAGDITNINKDTLLHNFLSDTDNT